MYIMINHIVTLFLNVFYCCSHIKILNKIVKVREYIKEINELINKNPLFSNKISYEIEDNDIRE